MFQSLSNMANLMRTAQQMQARMQEVQAELRRRRVFGSAGGGMVKVEMNGAGEMLGLEIEEQLRAKNDYELLGDLVTSAVNDAAARARALHAELIQETAGDIPGLGDKLAEMMGGGGGSTH